MIPVVLSRPPVVPVVEVSEQWRGIVCEWVGWDGSVWDLANGSEGVSLQSDGTEGMHDPILEKYESRSPAIAGKRDRGWQAAPRPVFWPVRITAASSEAWLEVYDRFFASIHPSKPGTWRVGFDGRVREIRLTGVYERGHSFGKHPTVQGTGAFGVTLEAAEPYWTGATVTAGPWRAATEVDFFNGGEAPDFLIAEDESFDTATISNPGDVEQYPTWIADDELTGVKLGVGTALIEVPFDVDDGQRLQIVTDPRDPIALLGPKPTDGEPFVGEDVTEQLGLQPFVEIQPGAAAAIHVEATGAGEISVQIVPLYFRALGRPGERPEA